MDWLRGLTIVSLLAMGVVAGGALVRLAVLIGDGRAVVAGLNVLAVLVVAVRAGARDRGWRENPYW